MTEPLNVFKRWDNNVHEFKELSIIYTNDRRTTTESRPCREADTSSGQSFKEDPRMVRFYIKAAQKYLETHPNNKITKLFNGNAYDWFTSQVFCDGERQFRELFGASPIFKNDAINTKAFLEKQFDIKL